MEIALVLLVLLLTSPFPPSSSSSSVEEATEAFDVRQHLATVTRYGAAKDANIRSFVPSVVPDGCSVIHLNLVARHGTRSPTTKRIKELDRLAVHLDVILTDAKDETHQSNLSLVNIPSWLWGWKSPWEGKQKGGELISKGENELYLLGKRIREKFPELFDEEYHPDVFSIRATQVPRVSASAVAFGMGLLSGTGNLGPGGHRAFSVISESRASDICLRFFDTCETYKKYRENQEPAVDKIKEPILDSIASEVGERYQLRFTKQDIASLWFLCKQEASLLDITDQACGLFNASEVSLLEWTDDIEGFLLNGYGNSVNYRMGIPLLHDVVQAIEQAIIAKEGNYSPATYEKARLRFAHAETVAPFTCLLGLFLEGTEFEQIQREEPLNLPPKPPLKRNWRGSIVAPFAGNTMLVLYGCHVDDLNGTRSSEDHRNKYYVLVLYGCHVDDLNGTRSSEDHRNKYYVQVLHNEIPVPIPGCDYTDFCPFEVFKERIVVPHFKHNFESVCNIKPENARDHIRSLYT